jgi:hypothetical protein
MSPLFLNKIAKFFSVEAYSKNSQCLNMSQHFKKLSYLNFQKLFSFQIFLKSCMVGLDLKQNEKGTRYKVLKQLHLG